MGLPALAEADHFRPKVPKVATLLHEAEHDVLPWMSLPEDHRAGLNVPVPTTV